MTTKSETTNTADAKPAAKPDATAAPPKDDQVVVSAMPGYDAMLLEAVVAHLAVNSTRDLLSELNPARLIARAMTIVHVVLGDLALDTDLVDVLVPCTEHRAWCVHRIAAALSAGYPELTPMRALDIAKEQIAPAFFKTIADCGPASWGAGG